MNILICNQSSGVFECHSASDIPENSFLCCAFTFHKFAKDGFPVHDTANFVTIVTPQQYRSIDKSVGIQQF